MARFMCIHTLSPQSMSRQQVMDFARAAQRDPEVRGYRSFISLSEGKLVCILDAPSREAVDTWFKTMGVPVDSITRVELEGDAGQIQQIEATPQWEPRVVGGQFAP